MLRRRTRFKHLEVRAGLRPTTVFDFRSENDRCKLSRRFFNHVICSTTPTDHNDRSISFHAVESDRDPVIHRESDRGACWKKLHVVKPRERLGKIQVTTRQTEYGLLGRDFPHQRCEIDIQISYRTPELINIVKTKNLWRQRR